MSTASDLIFLRPLSRSWAGGAVCDALSTWADRNRWWLFGFVTACYLAAFNGKWRMQPDAALYLSLGRNLAEGHGYTYLGVVNHLAYPGWPYLIAATFKLFATESLFPVHVLMLGMALIALAMTYRLVLLHSGRPTAVVVTVGVGLTKTFFCFGFELWSDMPFAMGVTAFLAGYEAIYLRRARWFDWLLLCGGLATAVVMRPTMWPLLLAIGAALLYESRKGHMKWSSLLGVGGMAALIAAACWALDPRKVSQQFGGQYEQFFLTNVSTHPGAMLKQAVTLNLNELLTRAASDALFQVRMGPFNIVLSLLVIFLGIGLFKERVLWGFWFCFLTATLLLILPLDRYFLPIIPLLVFAWWQAMVWVNRSVPRPWGNLLFFGLLAFGAGVNITKVGGIIMQQRTTPFLNWYDKGTFASVPQLAQMVQRDVPENGIVLVRWPYARVTSYLSRRSAIITPGTSGTDLLAHSVYVVLPMDQAIAELLQSASLTIGPALAQISPPPGAGPNARVMTLCRTMAK